MTQNDVNFERDLSDAFAPIKMSMELQQRLLAVPQVHAQRRRSWLTRLMPLSWLVGATSLSGQPAFGMTTGVAAACCSLVIGLSLGLGGVLPQTVHQTAQTTATTVVAAGNTTATTTTTENDPVSMLFAAADMPGDLP